MFVNPSRPFSADLMTVSKHNCSHLCCKKKKNWSTIAYLFVFDVIRELFTAVGTVGLANGAIFISFSFPATSWGSEILK